ncbi:hypothetical protein [Nocardioides salsibiostraticola]
MTIPLGRMALRRLVAVGGVASLIAGAALIHTLTTDQPSAPESSQASAATSLSLPPDGFPQDGPGLTEPGVFVGAEPLPDGRLRVKEWVFLLDPVEEIGLDAPDLTSAGPLFSGTDPSASSVRITADGGAVSIKNDTVDSAASLSVEDPTLVYEVKYELEGASVLSEGTATGRALAALTPLSTGLPEDLPVIFGVVGTSVRNLSCPASASPQKPCAEGKSPYMRTEELAQSEAIVVVQLDLPQ